MWRGYLLIVAAALFWGVSATGAKFLFNRNISPLALSEARAGISFLLLSLIFALTARQHLRRGWPHWRRLALLGILGVAGSNVTYYMAIQKSNVPTAILLQYTAPVWVAVYSFWRGERMTRKTIAALALSFGGCAVAIGAYDPSVLRLTGPGIGWALGSAFTFAFFNVFGGRMARELDHWTVLYYSFGFASLFWVFVYPPTNFLRYDARGWGALVLIALTASLVPFACYYGGLRYLRPTRAVITATLEPVFAILSSWLVLGQGLPAVRWLGAGGVLSAVLLLQHPESSPPASK